jgi:uncharacterized membrane protein YeiB
MTLGLATPPLPLSSTWPMARTAATAEDARPHRLELVDTLRGFVLFGVPVVGLRGFSPLDFTGAAVSWPLLVLGALLAGLVFGHADALRQSVAHRRFWRRLLLASLATGLLLALHVPAGRFATGLPHAVAALAQGLFCIAAFVLLFQHAAWRRRLRKLTPLGRMAWSNGLVQMLVGLSLFYGVGPGLCPKFGVAGLAVACMAILALQAAASCWWLRRYRLGPLEWAWRSLVQGRMAPMRSKREGQV